MYDSHTRKSMDCHIDLFNVIDIWTMEENEVLCITSGGYGM
jgi:hypothetical protein